MKKYILAGIVLISSINMQAQTVSQKVDALLKKMTLEDKVGQMTQVTLAVIAKGGWANTDGSLDAVKLKEAIQKSKITFFVQSFHSLGIQTMHRFITRKGTSN